MKKDELKRNISILDLLSKFGHSPKGYKKPFPCPFHEDTKPSAVIYSNLNGDYFKCFACDAKGDIFEVTGFLIGSIDFKDQFNYLKEHFTK